MRRGMTGSTAQANIKISRRAGETGSDMKHRSGNVTNND